MSISDVVLTETQAGVADSICETLSNDEKHLIFLEGLSSVGKSTLLDSIAHDIESARCVILNWGIYGVRNPEYKDKRLIVPVTPRELSGLDFGDYVNFSDSDVECHLLPAMSFDEITMLLQGKDNQTNLTLQELLDYSLGVPRLANRMLGDVSLTTDSAAKLAAHFLYESLQGAVEHFEKYFQMPILGNVEAAIPQIANERWYDIYEDIASILQRRESMQMEDSYVESPLFLAPESIGLYNQMLQTPDKTANHIIIFAPELSQKDLNQIQEELGIEIGKIEGGVYVHLSSNGSRLQMFGGISYHKTHVVIRDKKGVTYFQGDENPMQEWIQKEEDLFKKGELPIKSSESGGATFLFDKSDHSDVGRDETVRLGWVVESLLQQKNIPYIANNGQLRKTYAYIPQQQKIQMI